MFFLLHRTAQQQKESLNRNGQRQELHGGPETGR